MTEQRIVVGIDGSEPSKEALRWALHEAGLRNASLEVVHAWQYPAVGMTAFGGTAMPLITPDDLEKAADQVARETVNDVVSEEAQPRITTIVRMGHPAAVLVDVAQDADLLVVGSRGHGGFGGMLMGSVSSNVVHHASCPVAVIRRRHE